MESMVGPVVVSSYWTPDHLDVTSVPMTYARPKASWLDRYNALRRRAAIDALDRMRRRRERVNAVVDAFDVTAGPAVRRPVEPRTAA